MLSGNREMFSDNIEIFYDDRENFYDPHLISRAQWKLQFKESPGMNRKR
jgi:hypothetical protein